MATPRYFHFYDMPDFDARYGVDPALTRRCHAVAVSLYKLLLLEVRFLRTVPADCLDASIWDLCHCAGVVVDSIPFDGWTIEASCDREAPQLYKLARRFLEYNITGQAVREQLQTWIDYVAGSSNVELLEAVS